MTAIDSTEDAHEVDVVYLLSRVVFFCAAKSFRGPVNATAPHPVRQAHFSRALTESLGAPGFGGRLPTPPLAVRAMLGAERECLLLEGQRVLPARAQAAGFRFTYPRLEDALGDIYGRRPTQPVNTD